MTDSVCKLGIRLVTQMRFIPATILGMGLRSDDHSIDVVKYLLSIGIPFAVLLDFGVYKKFNCLDLIN